MADDMLTEQTIAVMWHDLECGDSAVCPKRSDWTHVQRWDRKHDSRTATLATLVDHLVMNEVLENLRCRLDVGSFEEAEQKLDDGEHYRIALQLMGERLVDERIKVRDGGFWIRRSKVVDVLSNIRVAK